MSLQIDIWPDRYAVCRLDRDQAFPHWALSGPFVSLTRTDDELSVVVRQQDVPQDVLSETGWRMLKLIGPFDFSLIGILASVVDPLRDAGLSVFAVSTYNTDHILVKDAELEQAVAVLKVAGHFIRTTL